MPLFIQGGPGGHEEDRAGLQETVPARVDKALEFLNYIARKQKRVPVASDNQIEIVEPDKITDEEEATQTSALVLLSRYFDGNLKHNEWEQLQYDSLKKPNYNDEIPSKVIYCVACGKNPVKSCQLCYGSGKLLIQPVGSADQEPMAFLSELINEEMEYDDPNG